MNKDYFKGGYAITTKVNGEEVSLNVLQGSELVFIIKEITELEVGKEYVFTNGILQRKGKITQERCSNFYKIKYVDEIDFGVFEVEQ